MKEHETGGGTATGAKMARGWRWLLVLVGLAGLGVAAWWALQATARVATVRRGLAVHAVPATVAVRAAYTMELRSEAGGRVKASELALGRAVKSGETLLEIDAGDLEADLKKLEDELATAKKRREVGSPLQIQLDGAKATLAATRHAAEAGNASQEELESQARAVAQLERQIELDGIDAAAAVTTLESGIDAQRRAIAKTKIAAPADGVVIAIGARPGDLIAAGAPLATLVSEARVVEARISEENFAGVAKGQEAVVRFLGYGAERFRATVAQVLPTADPQTQRYTALLDVDIARERLAPGLSGEASIIAGQHPGALLVPRRALLGDYVLVVKDGRVEQRRVQRGYTSMEDAEITDGLKEGERVITDELDTFRDGDRVRVTEAEQ